MQGDIKDRQEPDSISKVFVRSKNNGKLVSISNLVEYNEETNSVAMYFDEMPKNQICIAFQIEEILPVVSTQPSIAEIYDYYDQTDVFSVEYTY